MSGRAKEREMEMEVKVKVQATDDEWLTRSF